MEINEQSSAEDVVEEIRVASAELAWRDNDALVTRVDQILLAYLGNLSQPKRATQN